MADTMISLDKLKEIWHSQVHEENNWAFNMVSVSISFSRALQCIRVEVQICKKENEYYCSVENF